MPVLGQTPVRLHWESSQSITFEKIGSPYTDPNDSTKLVQDIKAHRTAQADVRTSTSETIDGESGTIIILTDASPAAPIAVALDSSIDDDFICDILNESSQTATLTPTSGDINDGAGAGSSATLPAGTSCTLSKTSSGSPAVAHWKVLKGAGSTGATDGGLQFAVKGNGSVPGTGFKHRLVMPFSGTIQSWTIVANAVGSATFTIKKSDYATFPTTSSIVASAKPTLTSAQKATSSTLTGWTTTVAKGDIVECLLDTVATVTDLVLHLQVTKTS